MRRYYVRVGQTCSLVETDNGVMAALKLFSVRIHPIDFSGNVEIRELTNHIREQKSETQDTSS